MRLGRHDVALAPAAAAVAGDEHAVGRRERDPLRVGRVEVEVDRHRRRRALLERLPAVVAHQHARRLDRLAGHDVALRVERVEILLAEQRDRAPRRAVVVGPDQAEVLGQRRAAVLGCPDATARPGRCSAARGWARSAPDPSGVVQLPSNGFARFLPSSSRNSPRPVPIISVPFRGPRLSEPTYGAAPPEARPGRARRRRRGRGGRRVGRGGCRRRGVVVPAAAGEQGSAIRGARRRIRAAHGTESALTGRRPSRRRRSSRRS